MPEDMNFAQWKAQNEANLEQYRATCQYNLEQMRVVNSAGQSALKSNVFLNAGASVAILAFLANVFDTLDANIAYKIIFSIGLFVTGALLGSIATGFTYLSQYSFHDEKNKIGSALNATTNVLVQISYNLFAIGSYMTFISMGAKFGLTVNSYCHWIFGIIVALLNTAILIVVSLVLKSKNKEA